jgi:hypothetical protein
MPPVGFEITFPESERPQTGTLDRAFIGNGSQLQLCFENNFFPSSFTVNLHLSVIPLFVIYAPPIFYLFTALLNDLTGKESEF